jgi:putative CocE/NonD family hydrolase
MKVVAAVLGMIASISLSSTAMAQALAFPQGLTRDSPVLSKTVARLADDVLGSGAEIAPGDRFRLELAAGRYAEAAASLAKIRGGRPLSDPALLSNLRWEVYARARQWQVEHRESFDVAFQTAAADMLKRVDDLTAYKFLYSLGTPLHVLDAGLDQALSAPSGKGRLDAPMAVGLIKNWLTFDAYHAFATDLAAVIDADDRRRYDIRLDIPVRTPDGAVICAYVVRPRTTERLPTLLNFTIYADKAVNLDNARITAAHGYAAVEGFTRGKACSPEQPIPVEHDGADADALIDWIATQPWSDGKVGMYGGSYEGFTQWAAAKHPPSALKALMPSVSFSPGTDFPMEGGVFMTQAFSWPLYTTVNTSLDAATYDDETRWARLKHDWYVSGRPYRDLDSLYGAPNPFFDRWLKHPDFDAYWRNLVPTDQELRNLSIPVLTTTGYYDSGQIGALSYLMRRERLNRQAEQYLVIGPYDHHTGQLGTVSPLGSGRPTLAGYDLDPVAQLDIIALRYAWFDYVLRGGPKPAILADRVNYEVMGANLWKHAPSIAALGGQRRRFYLGRGSAGENYALSGQLLRADASIRQVIDLADRRDINDFAPKGPFIDQSEDDWPIITRAPDLPNSLVFVSAPFAEPPEISGLFSGRLDVVSNKRDFDVAVTLFELTAQGDYIQLSHVWQRASYALDRSRRTLLQPGQRKTIDFTAGRLTSRQFHQGSRLVVVLNLIKQPGEQINYGTGEDVRNEAVSDAGAPLTIDWFGDSFIDVPLSDAATNLSPKPLS